MALRKTHNLTHLSTGLTLVPRTMQHVVRMRFENENDGGREATWEGSPEEARRMADGLHEYADRVDELDGGKS